MKKYLLLVILLMSSLAWAGSTTVVVGQGGGEPAACETALWTNTGTPTGDYDINDADAACYAGQIFKDVTNRTICKVVVYVSWRAGDLTGKTFRGYFTDIADGSNRFTPATDLTEADNTVSCSAAKCELADAGGEGTAWTFNFSSGFTATANNKYAFVVTMDGAADASNYAELEYIGSSDNVPGGTAGFWSTDGQTTGGTASDIKIVFYTN